MADEVNPLHEDFINSAPEELRDAAAELAPVWDQYVQGKFTEAAEFRKQYEPYQELPLDQLSPEGVQEVLAFQQIQNDPVALKAWHDQWEATLRSEHPEFFDENEYGEFQQDPRIAAELNQTKQQLQELTEWRAGLEQNQSAQDAADFVNGQVNQLKEEYKTLTDEDIDSICVLATKYVPQDGSRPADDFIQQGFKDFQRIVGQTERELFKAKDNQPTPAMHGGRSNNVPTPITTFDGANEAAKRAIIESMRNR